MIENSYIFTLIQNFENHKLTLFSLNSSKFDPMNVVTNPISSSDPTLTCQVNEEDLILDQNSSFNATISIIDSLSLKKVQDIAWKVINH